MIAILLAALFTLVIVSGMVWQFGHPALDNHRSLCPKCGAQALLRLDSERSHEHRLRIFVCRQCGTGYREELDRTFTEV